MPETAKNIAIGTLVVIALGLLLWTLLFLHPSYGDGKFRLHVRFNDIEKINIGTRVTYAGRAVGEVVKIEQVPEEDRHASTDPEDIYIYDLTLAMDSTVPLYDSDEITVGTSGLMGERFIAVIPKRPKNHKASPIAYNEVVYSTKPHSMDDAFSQISSLAMKAEETMDVLASLIKENREDVDHTLVALKGACMQLNTLLAKANSVDLVGSLNNTAGRIEKAAGKAEALIANVAEGQGTIGKFLTQDAFYEKTVGMIDKMDLLMNDVNRYGVLYHLDKSWQRDRKRNDEMLARKQAESERSAQIAEQTKE